MENLPPDLSPATIAEWIKAGPWVVAIGLVMLMMRRDLLAFLFPARSDGPSEDHSKAMLDAHHTTLEETKKTNELVKELLGVQRLILNEVVRGSDRAG